MLIVQLATAVIVASVYRRSEAARWFIFFLLCGCLGDLYRIAEDSVKPAMRAGGMLAAAERLGEIQPYLYFVNLTCAPYAILMFAVIYSERVGKRAKNRLAIGLAAPVAIMIGTTSFAPVWRMDYALLLAWAGPYYLSAIALLFWTAARERAGTKRRGKWVLAFLVAPPLLAYLLLDTVPHALRQEQTYVAFLPPLIVLVFALFVLLGIRFGVMGIRIRLEKQVFDSTYQAVAFGSGSLHHMWKNRTANMSLLLRNAMDSDLVRRDETASRNMDLLHEEIERMDEMMARLNKQLRDIAVYARPCKLKPLVEEAVRGSSAWIESKGIRMAVDIRGEPELEADAVHMTEVLTNLIRNAAEAVIPGEGRIGITVYEDRKNAVLSVTDNGHGMSGKEAKNIFGLFYSTKDPERNFGIGLAYSLMVVRKHGGTIEVASAPGQGSTFLVRLPKTRSPARRFDAHDR
ncbi:sensor histidine kinase [Cohnella caldifontis]|uniref:sensor histidine kinase n=1 Tax=Cohnella caldifontis TaxID=3027471 RepID=UPI0023ED0072|nr:HAMP domain-containing sensor histidine kinase [Cohnella sp. YIM B05605]